MYIGIDFDGTCVTHEYPRIGRDIGAYPWLKRFVKLGAKLILVTMRDGQECKDAVVHLARHGIELFGINHNPTQKQWTMSPKPYAQLYIDDAAFGVPLCPAFQDQRAYVDWSVVGPAVVKMLQQPEQ